MSEGGLALLDWWVEQTAWHLADRSRQDYEWAADRLLGKAGSLTEAQDYLRWRISLGRCDLKYMPNDYLPTWRANNSAKPRQLTPSEVFRAFAEGKSVEEIEDESARGVARTGSPLVSLPAPLPRNPKGA